LGTLAPRAERQSARMSEIKNDGLGLHGAEYSKFDRIMTKGFKGLSAIYTVLLWVKTDAGRSCH